MAKEKYEDWFTYGISANYLIGSRTGGIIPLNRAIENLRKVRKEIDSILKKAKCKRTSDIFVSGIRSGYIKFIFRVKGDKEKIKLLKKYKIYSS